MEFGVPHGEIASVPVAVSSDEDSVFERRHDSPANFARSRLVVVDTPALEVSEMRGELVGRAVTDFSPRLLLALAAEEILVVRHNYMVHVRIVVGFLDVRDDMTYWRMRRRARNARRYWRRRAG